MQWQLLIAVGAQQVAILDWPNDIGICQTLCQGVSQIKGERQQLSTLRQKAVASPTVLLWLHSHLLVKAVKVKSLRHEHGCREKK